MPRKAKPIVSLPPPPPVKTWQVVASKEDIKYDSIPYIELMQWVMANVPQGTPFDDIRLSFDVDTTTGYYDDVTTDVSMKLTVLM
jgi:hypothetical protein